MTARERLIDYFNENEEVFNECIEELDQYCGYLGDYRYYNMEDLNEFYSSTEPLEFLNRVYYGHDEENGSSSEFNPNREYFRYNGYGNLVSSDYKDYTDHLDDYFIDKLIEEAADIYTIEQYSELQEIFEELDNEEEDQ